MLRIAIGGPDPVFGRTLARLVAPAAQAGPVTSGWRRSDGPVLYAMELAQHQQIMQRIRSTNDAAHLVSTAARHIEEGQPPVVVYLQNALPSREPGEPWPSRGVTIVGNVMDLLSALEAQGVPCQPPWPGMPPAPHSLPAVTCRHQAMPAAFTRRAAVPPYEDEDLWVLTLGGYGQYRTEVGLWRQTAQSARGEWITNHPDLADRVVRGWHDPSAIWSDGLDTVGLRLMENDGPDRWPALAVALSIHLGRTGQDVAVGRELHTRVRWALERGNYEQTTPTRPSSTRDPVFHELFLWAGLSPTQQASELPEADQERLLWWATEGVHLVARREHDIFVHLPRGSLAPCLDSLGLLAPEVAEAAYPGPHEDPLRLLAEAEAEARGNNWFLSAEHESRLSECLGYLGDTGDRAADRALSEWLQGWSGGKRFGKKVGRMIAQWPTLSPSLIVGVYSVLGRGQPEAVSRDLIDRVPADEMTPEFRALVKAHHAKECVKG